MTDEAKPLLISPHSPAAEEATTDKDQQDLSDKRSKPMTKTESWLRWPILVLSCMAMFGSYYCYDNPAALQNPLKAYLNLNDGSYNLLYSVYSYPNVILPLFGGMLLTTLGMNYSIILFLSFIIIGQGLFALGVSLKSYALAIVGRTIFGFGGESLSVAETTLLATWFGGKEIALAMGINLTVARLGSVVNDNVSPALFKTIGLPQTLWFGFGVTIFCMLCVFAMIAVDSYADKKYTTPADKKAKADEAAASGSVFTLLTDFVTKSFSLSYALITISCFVVYATVLPFNNIASGFLNEKFLYDTTKAGAAMGIPFFISAIGSPFLGGLVDLFGYRAVLLTLSAASLLLAHFLFAVIPYSALSFPFISLVIIGISYMIYSSVMWPCVAFVVEPRYLGVAYGLTTAFQNIGLAVVPQIVGALKDRFGSYKSTEFFFVGLDLTGVLVGLFLNFVDWKYERGVLNFSRIGNEIHRRFSQIKPEDENLIVSPEN